MKNITFRRLVDIKDFNDLKNSDKLLIKSINGEIGLLTIDKIGNNIITFKHSSIELCLSHYAEDLGYYREIYLVK